MILMAIAFYSFFFFFFFFCYRTQLFGINVTHTGSAKQTQLHIVCSGNSVETYSLKKGLRVSNVTMLFSVKSTLAPHSMRSGAKSKWMETHELHCNVDFAAFYHNTLLKALPLAIFNEDLFHFMVHRGKGRLTPTLMCSLEGGIWLYCLFLYSYGNVYLMDALLCR